MKQSINYPDLIKRLEAKGKEIYSPAFSFHKEDHPLIARLLCYFAKDEPTSSRLGIDLKKGICLAGPVGCGKTSLMNLLRLSIPPGNRFIIKPCRDVSFEFMQEGYDTILKHSQRSFENYLPKVYCYDDLGAESSLKFFGNEINLMAEILLSRYDLFTSRRLLTHLTTNLTPAEIETAYGTRVRSRMRETFNFLAIATPDKRK